MRRPRPHPTPVDRVHDIESITRAMRAAIHDAMVSHKRQGNPMVVWREGKVVWIRPEDIPVDVNEPND